MKFRKPTKLQFSLLICLGLFAAYRIFFRAPSEAEMIAKFHQHRGEFEQIRLMLQQDKSIATIGPDWVDAKSVPDKVQSEENKKLGATNFHEGKINVSPARIELYRTRLRNLGFSRVDTNDFLEDDDHVQLELFGGGFADTTWGIGYLWVKETPKPLVKSAYAQRPERDKWLFSRIEGDWYIYQRR